MKDMKKVKCLLSILCVIILCALPFILSGCLGGSDSSTISSLANPFAGNSSILGEINLSSLISSDQSAIDGSSGSPRIRGKKRYSVDPSTEAVKLFVIGDDGELEDTGISCACEIDPNNDDKIIYTCPGIKDGINYIVKYFKILGEDKAVEMSANAYVPEGQSEADVDVTAKTSTIVECLTTAILDATEGTGIDQEIVNKIINAVKDAIENLVESGAIQIPSMIVDVEGDTIAEVFGEDTENENLNNTSGTVISDPNVSTDLDAVKNDIEAGEFDISTVTTDTEKAALINRIFVEMLEDGSVPDFMLEFFTDLYIDNETVAIGALADAVKAGMEFYVDPPSGFDPNDSTAAVYAFKGELINMLDLVEIYEDPNDELTTAEKEDFADYPPVVLGLFPLSERTQWDNLDPDTLLNVPQGIAYVIYEADVYFEEAYEDPNAEFNATQGEGGNIEYDKDEPFDFDPMAPGSIMDLFGFFDVAENYADGIDIFELWLHPNTYWDDVTGTQKDMLHAGTCWMDMDMLIDMMQNPNTAVDPNYTVTLTYPTASGGTGTIQLINEAALYGEEEGMSPFDNCWMLDPWMEANPNQHGGGGDWNQPDPERIVSDFTTGTYRITVETPTGETYYKDFYRKVITGMADIYPTLISPAPMPIWPGHDATQEEMDEFNAAMMAYTMTNYSATVDTDADTVPDSAKITVSWNPPQVEEGVLPDGIKMGYQLDVGYGGCDPNGCYWEHIYATWDNDKVLFGTSFTVPVLLPKRDPLSNNNYQVHVNVVFIDQATGDHIGQGGNAHGEFLVADPLDPNATFTITGPVTIRNMQDQILTLSDVQNMKAILFRETYDENNEPNPWIRTILKAAALEADPNDPNGIIYTLQPTISNYLDPNADPGSWVGIDILHDIDNDGVIDDTLAVEPWHEPWWGPYWDADYNVWFETWGGILRVRTETCDQNGCTHQETIITGGEVVDGPMYSIDLWYDPNVSI